MSAAPAPTEHQIQCAIVELLERAADPRVIWFHPANGEKRDIHTAARLKRMGVRAGVADLAFTLLDGRSAYLEVKTGTGTASATQREFRARCCKLGAPYHIVRSVTEAADVLRSLGVIRNPNP